ncbi:type II toxin-antitoxin system RelE/ParE family toxin [Facklamia languida]|uniref:RelE/StbE family addiction module toxin n=1 Tax=Facklamia languida CCUG 37842 TaxID=883113 RepID=H3NJF0_9LACT|nr:type II toxin-antitoxin system RelE/ParE family toxin [Facklamia languida]EHR36763.1 hypothetical protein HMPREF9708_00989 [Facklamia languida CCUG 37842]
MANYRIRILPSFEEDLNQIVDYIALTLSNPSAAMNLVENVHKAIEGRANYPLNFQPFLSQKKRKHPYYVIRVGNYSIFYVVIDSVMEIRRILYTKRRLDSQL